MGIGGYGGSKPHSKHDFGGHAHTGYNRYVCRLGIVENYMLWTCQLSSMSMLQYLTLETPLRLWMRAASARLSLWAMGRAPLFSFFPLPPGTFPLFRVLLALLFGIFFFKWVFDATNPSAVDSSLGKTTAFYLNWKHLSSVSLITSVYSFSGANLDASFSAEPACFKRERPYLVPFCTETLSGECTLLPWRTPP